LCSTVVVPSFISRYNDPLPTNRLSVSTAHFFNKMSLFLYCSVTRGNWFALNSDRIFEQYLRIRLVPYVPSININVPYVYGVCAQMSHEKLWTEACSWERVRQNGTEILSRWCETHWRSGFLIFGLRNVCLPLRTVWWGYCHSNRFQVSASSELRWQARLTIVLVVSFMWKVGVICTPSGTRITRPSLSDCSLLLRGVYKKLTLSIFLPNRTF